MKKILFMMVATSIAMAAQAKILRVSNVEGSSALYKNINAAINAAEEGDTIMVDASPMTYGNVSVTKRVVLLGPGYWLQENGIIQEGGETAEADMSIYVDGVVIKGFTLGESIYIHGARTVVNRCKVGKIELHNGANNCIIHQNYCEYIGPYSLTDWKTSNHQITNNIMTGHNQYYIATMTNSLFAYNTCIGNVPSMMGDGKEYVSDCTIEHNVFIDTPAIDSSNNMENNKVLKTWPYTETMVDKEVLAAAPNLTDGAFAGDDPYILSGVPAGPVIQNLIVPTTVEKGSKMSVTIKVGVVK